MWPRFENIRDSGTNIKLLDILFEQIKCFQVGLEIMLNNNAEYSTLWIDAVVWYQDVKKEYGDYLQDMYEIRGAVFHHKDEAIKFQDILEKKYMWKILQS